MFSLSHIIVTGALTAYVLAQDLASTYVPARYVSDDQLLVSEVDFSLGPGYPSCVILDLSTNFPGPNDNGRYNLTWVIPDPGETCNILLLTMPPVDEPNCGIVIGSFSHSTELQISLSERVALQFACGYENKASALIQRSEYAEGDIMDDATLFERTSLESTSSTASLEQRGTPKDCSYVPDRDMYTALTTTNKMSQETSCTSSTCELTATNAVTTTTSTTFTEGGNVGITLFEIIDAGVSFEYSDTFGTEKMVQMSEAFTIEHGQTGHVTFTPKMQCTSGYFSGDGCAKAGIDTGVQGQTCVPLYLSDGETPDGFWYFVQTN